MLGSRDHYILLFLERTLIFVSPIFIRDPEVNGATGDLSDRSLAGMGITLTAPERERMFSSITPLRVLTAMLAPLELGAEMVWPNWLNLLGRKASDSEDAADAEEAPESRDKSSGSGKKTKKTGDSERSEGSLDRSTVAPAELTVVAPDVCGWGDDVHPRLVISAHEVDAKARLVVGDYISRGRTFSTFKAVLSTPEADVQVVAKFAGLPRAWARQSEKREFTSQRRARAHAVHEAELLSGPLRELQGRAVPRFFGLWANVDSDLQSCPRIERLSDLGWDFDQESDEEEDEASYLLTVMEYLPEYEGAVS